MSKRKGIKEQQMTGEQREAARRETRRQRETAKQHGAVWQKSKRCQETRRQKSVRHREAAETRQERRPETRRDRKKELERLILEYTEELAEDINLRLLAQQDIGPAGIRRGHYHTGEVLYVESIIVADMRYPKEKKRGSALAELGNNVINRMKRR